ncbi:hypothetical protein ACFVXE_32445 [Streptomyces sp. NPDC058231]|uniref:hypothetical protein n=1 Tax=Streptomyces sp. NPDC058231 TaxID=3346392 RepID=UPI0036E1283E
MIHLPVGLKGLGASAAELLHYHPSNAARVASGWDSEKSRRVMCAKYQGPGSGGYVLKKTFVNDPWTFMHPEIVGGPNPDSISCDEFPFASTYESPGTPAANGG